MTPSPRFLLVPLLLNSFALAETTKKPADTVKPESKQEAPRPAAVSTVSIEDISGFEQYPKQVKSLIQSALALTRLELAYTYGSHEPGKGGMDCSGTVYHVLGFQGLKGVPRQSDEMCQWVEKKSQLHLTPTATAFDHAEFAALQPGDLLFWTNTTTTQRKLPVTHVMIYLGKQKKTGKRIVFGASDGRSFQGERRSGVSVFDFHLPKAESTARFYGYGAAPGLLPVAPVPIAAPTPPPAPVLVAAKPEEVRKAVAIVTEAKPEPVPAPEVKPAASQVEPKPAPQPVTVVASKPKTTTATKPKTTGTKKPAASTTAKKKSPPPTPRSQAEQTIQRAVDSVRRFFR